MESAAELHQARILRGQIESLEVHLESARAAGARAAVPVLEAGLEKLRDELRRVLACRADADFERRRAQWRLETRKERRGSRACA